jgi:hypothetical protein
MRPYLKPALNVLVILKFMFLGLACVCSILASIFYGEALQETYPALEWAISSCSLLSLFFLILTMVSKLVFLFFVVTTYFTSSF